MDPNIQKALTDKLYDKRKSGALECVASHVHALQCSADYHIVVTR
jgi:hypothetical protein